MQAIWGGHFALANDLIVIVVRSASRKASSSRGLSSTGISLLYLQSLSHVIDKVRRSLLMPSLSKVHETDNVSIISSYSTRITEGGTNH